MPPPWEALVQHLPPPGVGAAGWEELNLITHATHAPDAIRIAQDGWIYPQLVQEGPLAETRTRVAFFSPKRWYGGTRYGVITFKARWSSLFRSGARLYWVETDTDYQNKQFRILVTDRDVAGLDVLPYDPSRDDGPVRLISGRWFWAEAYAAEFLFVDAINVVDLCALGFTEHRKNLCPSNRDGCPEYGTQGRIFGERRFLAGVIGGELVALEHLFKDAGQVTSDVSHALGHLLSGLGGLGVKHFTGSVSSPDEVDALITGACLALARHYKAPASSHHKLITKQIASQDLFLDGFERVVRKTLRAPSYSCR